MTAASHFVNDFWLGEPLTRAQLRRMPASDHLELLGSTSHRLQTLPFVSKDAGHSHVHYLKVVTKLLKHSDSVADLLSYKYTVHSNLYEAPAKEEPMVEFKYDLSPISIVVQQERNSEGFALHGEVDVAVARVAWRDQQQT